MTTSKTPHLDRVQRCHPDSDGEMFCYSTPCDSDVWVDIDEVRAAVALDMAALEAAARRDERDNVLCEVERAIMASADWKDTVGKPALADELRQLLTLVCFARHGAGIDDSAEQTVAAHKRAAVQATSAAESNELQGQHAHANMPPLPR